MPTPFKCPHCGVQLGQADDHAGRTMSCPGCGQTVTWPTFSPAPVEGPAEPASGKGCGCGSVAVSLLLIGVLVVLLLPALQPAREAARRTQKLNDTESAGASSYSNLSAARSAGIRPDQGLGPGLGGDKYAPIEENPFQDARQEPLSTFSIDVDTASYSKVRMYLLEQATLPRPDAVRLEELINDFPYDYEPPQDGQPFAARLEAAECPWAPKHRLVRIGIKGRKIPLDKRPPSNLVFLLDVSGSMNEPNKLPLVRQGMRLLADQLNENDRVAIVVYASATGLLLDSTTGDRRSVIRDALDRLHAGGSTNGGEGLQLAYQVAQEHFLSGGVNRVILCTDGDFNVGVTGTDELVRMVQERARSGVFLSVLGFGMGNHNDELLEQISNKGNGNYAFIDTAAEARKVLVEQMAGTLITIAKDVKVQVEFNPQQVAAYRLLGYENRLLAALSDSPGFVCFYRSCRVVCGRRKG